jgi:NTP pyrophosphatase (non-canonical NTP hydrolase)
MGADIDALTRKLRAFAKARNWSQFHSPKNLACALSVESGELLENFQWLTDEESCHLTDIQKQAVAMEVADVLLYLVQLCDALDIDLVRAGHEKLVLNEKRYPVERARDSNKKYTEL